MKLFALKVICEYQAQIEFRMRFPLPFVDWRVHSILLLRYHTGRRRIEWEVWRFISTPGTDESMAALSQTRAAMLWSVKQKYDPSKSLRFKRFLDTRSNPLCSTLWNHYLSEQTFFVLMCSVDHHPMLFVPTEISNKGT